MNILDAKHIFSYRKYWAQRFGTAHELPMSQAEMDVLGWDSCDVILVTGDAYIDHPSFGMALIGRVLEAQGFRVGIISQPDWRSAEDFNRLGRPNLFFGVTGGNMDSMVNRYTSDKKIRSNDAYTANGEGGKRPDRAVNVYSHRCREAYKDVPIIIGGIEASLRRIAHYDYWSDKVRKSVLLDSKADMLVYGNAERQITEIAHRLASGESITDLKGIRGTVHFVKQVPAGWTVKDSSDIDTPGKVIKPKSPYLMEEQSVCSEKQSEAQEQAEPKSSKISNAQRAKTVIRLPDFDTVKDDPIQYAHASRVMHGETNPGNARPLLQKHMQRYIWVNPPPIPLTMSEMDGVFDLSYSRLPHTVYGKANIPAFEMIQHSVNIMRGCFGGCSFCSITEHEGRIIQSRSEDSIIKEIEAIRDTSPNFTGNISDLGGPTANMYRLACKDEKIEAACRLPSCVFPGICENLDTNHTPLIKLYRRARALKGIKKIFIASGLRYDLAIESPEYVKELVTHHVGGYLKIAPEHTEQGPLSKMMKPGMGTYDRFKEMFDKYSKEVGKEQYLIPYFIAAHPGTEDEDMLNLALWLKRNGFRADQVQAFLPSPMSIATAMYHSGKDTLHKVSRRHDSDMPIPKGIKQRRLHKALLRYHDPKNWPLIREALKNMGRSNLIGNGKRQLIPAWQPKEGGKDDRIKGKGKTFRTQRTEYNKRGAPAKRHSKNNR
ncbi:YgiQ family radical SAM protein [Methylococcaceae bacterium CS5]|nr:YgiQ family radical SAM protein [Methylococcaceae bacterium CS4]TXK98951.1 YgiQ family radical SAM protein [Methylococcaceae bacterium CS5]TXL06850.1 YgiQ family radical SAM protein [Methylococcaceae bacterium CS3]TXL11395.1 YgiQ family radical SAM protein [Methylococcaceae bacterium CS2]